MTQRNPMNDRYMQDDRQGVSRKSAASARLKSRAAASVRIKELEKTPAEKRAQRKEARREAQRRQAEIDRKYYKPDTLRYKKLRRYWWAALIGAVVSVALSWVFQRTGITGWLPMVTLIAGYVLIILAFYIDFSKIRKERNAYQQRMVLAEKRQKDHEKAVARASKGKSGNAKRGEMLGADDAANADVPAAKPEQKSLVGRLMFWKKDSGGSDSENAGIGSPATQKKA